MDQMTDDFKRDMLEIGIVSTTEQENMWDVAKRCAKTAGVPTAGAGAVLGSQMGAVTVPVVGAVPGMVAGALAGLVGGTISCTMLNASFRSELRRFAREY